MLQSVAAAGYLIVSIDHPYDADIVEFPDGTTFKGANLDGDEHIDMALATRVDDISFVHQQINNIPFTRTFLPSPGTKYGGPARKTAVVGHSFGGAAAAAGMLANPAILGGVNLDGTMFGDVVEIGLDRPFMLIGHENKTQDTDPSWKAVWPKPTGWKREFEIKKAAHYSFSDLPLVTEVLGLQKHLSPELGQVLGTVEGSRMANLTVSYVTTFLDFVLKGKPDESLQHSGDFPEIVVHAV